MSYDFHVESRREVRRSGDIHLQQGRKRPRSGIFALTLLWGALPIVAVMMVALASQRVDAAEPQASASTVVSRVPLPARHSMTPQQREIYKLAVKYLGGPYGPRIALINSPGVARAWSDLLTALEATKLDRRLWELTILIVAREWDSQFEWWAHVKSAGEAGIPAEVIEALRLGKAPTFTNGDEAAVYAYFTELYRTHDVSDATYERLRGIIGANRVVELTVLAGHYNNVAMTLAAHRVPLPPGVRPELPPKNAARASSSPPN